LGEQLQIPRTLALEYLLKAAHSGYSEAQFWFARRSLADKSTLDRVFAKHLLSEAGISENIYALKHATAQQSGADVSLLEEGAPGTGQQRF
jgi:hypothetical protein